MNPPAAEALVVPEEGEGRRWNSFAVARDFVTVGAGSLLATVFNAALVFLIPRLVSIEDYGYWRLFLLYAGYVGLLHLGLADGALLRWAGKPLPVFRHEVLASVKFLFWQQIALIIPCCAILVLALPARMHFIGISVVVFALCYNISALLQYALQSARTFRPVAIATAAPYGLFLAFVLVRSISGAPSYRQLVLFYFISWVCVLSLLWVQAKPWQGSGRAAANGLGRTCIRAGLPILLANLSMVVLQCIDRLAVSWATTIQNFAQYSLAASAMAVPIAGIQAAYSVFFSHMAGLDPERRKGIYRSASRFLLLAWSLSLPYDVALDAFVRHFLPRYIVSLPIARMLLLGILFLGGIQVLHMSFSYLHGRQRRFLVRTLVMLPVGLGFSLFAVIGLRSLIAVAAAQVLTLGLWWLANEWSLRDLSGQSAADWAKFVAVFLVVSGCYWSVLRYGQNTSFSLLLYYGCVALVLTLTCRSELRLVPKLLLRRQS